MRTTFIFLFLLLNITFAQVDIVPALKDIESGELEEAQTIYRNLKAKYPNDANVNFLDAVLTENGEEALHKYSLVFTKHPKSQFADAALYRVFSYYYSLGIYNKAEKYLTQLKETYPSSPYIKAADRTLPSEDFFVKTEFKEPKVETAPPPRVYEEKYNYTIQAGAFLNKKNANNLKSKFEAKGIYSNVYPKEVGGSLLNIVVVGKFIDPNSAQPILEELKKDYKLNGRVVPLNWLIL